MKKSLHIFIDPSSDADNDEVTKKMNLALDWYRYSENCWIVKTTSSISKWRKRLEPLVGSTGSLLILEIDPESSQGWISESFWTWMKKAFNLSY